MNNKYEFINRKEIPKPLPVSEPVKDSDGNVFWRRNNELHRDDDQPAIELKNGYRAWLRDGKLHRDNDQPAIINRNGYKEWWVDGKLIKTKWGSDKLEKGYIGNQL